MIQTERRLPDGSRLIYRADFMPVYSSGGWEYNPDWRFADAAGHLHYRGDGDFPTLDTVYEEPWWCDICQDLHEDFIDYYACKLCGEHIAPGRRDVPAATVMVKTSEEWYLADVPVADPVAAMDMLTDGVPVRIEHSPAGWRAWIEYKPLTREEAEALVRSINAA